MPGSANLVLQDGACPAEADPKAVDPVDTTLPPRILVPALLPWVTGLEPYFRARQSHGLTGFLRHAWVQPPLCVGLGAGQGCGCPR